MSNQDLSAYSGIWCVGEVRHGKLAPTIFEILTAGGQIAAALGQKLSVVLIGSGLGPWTKEVIEAGADQVYLIDHSSLEQFVDEAYAKALTDLVNQEKPRALFLPASTIGRSLAGRAAVMLKTGAAADLTDLSAASGSNGFEKGTLLATRPSYGGNILATLVNTRSRPEIYTIRPMVFPRSPKDSTRTGVVRNITVDPATWNLRTKFIAFQAESSNEIDIGSADKIVSGGRGLGKAEGFETVRSLAKALSAAVGASRAAVDSGWIPYKHQVGITGRTVRPKLYVACGVSGQVQHLAGMGQSEVIVAINKDPECPMMKLASFSIEADLYEFIPAAVKELQKHQS
ncbi:MAG: electron transfer flavoprotein subunit alpha/FixB family protein [Elusimicrobia bacterium]|nr:electron transfer flavoprotein subunit alpha/FixB family protein [Elusimicrobiota bacterium]